MRTKGRAAMKKEYEKPAVTHTEEIEGSAIQCAKSTSSDAGCVGKPLNS